MPLASPCLGNLHDTTVARWNSVPAIGLATPTHDHLEGLVGARVGDRRCLTPGCILHVFWLYYGGASLFVASSLASWRTTPESFPATPELVRTCRRQASLCQMSSLQPKAMRLDQVKTRWQSIWMTCSAGAQRHCPAAAVAPAAFPRWPRWVPTGGVRDWSRRKIKPKHRRWGGVRQR